MKKITTLFCFFLMTNISWAQHISDANFAAAIRAEYPSAIDANNNLTSSKNNVTSLNVSSRNISDLTGIGGCMVTDTIFIKLLLAPIVPNAFTPNGDGINDRWRIQYLESYPGATVDVYNRYGQAVFSSEGYDVDWDGTVNGKALPIGTYYYVINPKNGRKIIAGSITIIR